MAKTKQELVTLTPEEQRYLESIGGGAPEPTTNGPKRLIINKKSKDEDGNKRAIGSWNIEGTDVYFDGVAKFRPVRYANKLIRYVKNDNGGFDFGGQSVYFTDFRDEILDSTGGLALGRKFGKSYTPEEKAATKHLAETYMDIFGFVTFDKDEYPVLLRVRGGNMKIFGDAFASIPQDKKYSQYSYNIEPFQPEILNSATGKMEQKEYWNIKVTPDMSEILPILPILKYDNEIMEHIRDTNATIFAEHKKNRNKADAYAGGEAKMANATVVGNTFDDELPF